MLCWLQLLWDTSFLHRSGLSQARQRVPLGIWQEAGPKRAGRMLGGSGPRLLREDDGCWGGVGVGHPFRAPVAEPRVKGSCSAWLGGRDGDAARREETMQITLAPGQEVLLLTCRKSPHVVQKYDFIQTFL